MHALRNLLSDIPRDADGVGGGGSSSGAPPGDGGAPASDAGNSSAPPLARPDWVPEQFFDEKAGLKLDELGAHFSELSQFKTQADERAKTIPAKPEDYKATLPQDFKIEGAPDGLKVTFDEKDPLLVEARAVAKDIGLPQEAFSKLLALEAKRKVSEALAADAALASERKKLGEKADDRITAVDAYLKRNLPAAHYQALLPVASSAAAIEAIETLIAKANGGAIPSTPAQTTVEPELTLEQKLYGNSPHVKRA